MPYPDEGVKVKGVADIVFVIDVSGSMTDVIDGVKNNVGRFVTTLLTDPQSTVKDVRLGLVTHDVEGRPEVYVRDFVSEAASFVAALGQAPEGGTEFGLPAIDKAADFNWRAVCRRYVVVFTDEPVDGGHEPAFQRSKLAELARKLADQHIHFVGYGPTCDAYALLGKTPGSEYHVTDRTLLEKEAMASVLGGLVKTVSVGVDDQVFSNSPKNLYGLVDCGGGRHRMP